MRNVSHLFAKNCLEIIHRSLCSFLFSIFVFGFEWNSGQQPEIIPEFLGSFAFHDYTSKGKNHQVYLPWDTWDTAIEHCSIILRQDAARQFFLLDNFCQSQDLFSFRCWIHKHDMRIKWLSLKLDVAEKHNYRIFCVIPLFAVRNKKSSIAETRFHRGESDICWTSKVASSIIRRIDIRRITKKFCFTFLILFIIFIFVVL